MVRRSLGFTHERAYLQRGIPIIIGCDEVGRGSLAGPVVAGAVFFDWENEESIAELQKEFIITDSKLISSARREEAAEAIRSVAKRVAIGIIDVQTIDKINILQASLRAMRDAVLGVMPLQGNSIILVDGNKAIPGLSLEQETIIDGDAKLFSIAAASIVAKVYRDKLMDELHEAYPLYGWDRNKGYGTRVHQAAIEEFGLTPHHRKTFCQIA